MSALMSAQKRMGVQPEVVLFQRDLAAAVQVLCARVRVRQRHRRMETNK
jgi:hypothetical protein